MKGLAVLALGAILIWFGLSRSGGASDGTVQAGSGSSAPDEAGARSAEDATLVLQQRRESVREVQDPGVPQEHRPSEALDTDVADRDFVEEPAFEEERPEVPVVPESDARATLAGGLQGEGQALRLAGDDGAGLMFREGPDPERVATYLLEAWISGTETRLEVFLREGEGVELPAAKRQLVASFWQAISGYPDDALKGLDQIRGADGVTTAQESLLSAALDIPGSRAVPRSASSGRVEPLAYAMRMILLGDEAQELLRKREYARSAVAWSDLIQYEVNAPWEPHREALLLWGDGLDRAQANHRFNVNGSWPSIEEKVQPGGNLIRLRQRVVQRRSDLELCTGLISRVNGVSGYVHPNDIMRIPTDPVNVIVDLDARVLLYRHGDEVVKLWDIGIGKPGHETPIGVFEIGHKIDQPAHTTLGLSYGDSRNELGSRWMGLRRPGQDKDTSYGIHGTQHPEGVGGAVSLGCVRMRNEEVNELFEILPVGAEVVIQG